MTSFARAFVEHDSKYPPPDRTKTKCLGMDPTLFHPPEKNPQWRDEAEQFCRGCAVRAECLLYGLRQPDGIWGGADRWVRRSLLRKVRRSGLEWSGEQLVRLADQRIARRGKR